ncbi:NADH dehydrogenase [ubiquinone] 1 alpha subcomplex subunit 6-like [Hyposmocoma kahamanoa]|uniref:NADH dehydrogenase [ubiquinone] 1 alpha subcomplex subunit 6-like n=1 Tax=Hyposmocoma kahamanoa TaxID=1477025 RepID=UPI000E6D7944|nr:NADH dehydrogenase [ubiquinone] 1 alpha subcomplex subunit 6-like [Hyposmocoma kahamanoa]
MAARGTMAGCKIVRPVMSFDNCEAHTRVLGLYRAFYRIIPFIQEYYYMPKSEKDIKTMIRSYFYANSHVEDVRVIDLLILKGWIEYTEVDQTWQQKGHVMAHWHPSQEPKPISFIGKFLEGND